MKATGWVVAFLAAVPVYAAGGNSFDPCDAPALSAAKEWALAQGRRGNDFQIVTYGTDGTGKSLARTAFVQLADPYTNGDCWTNIVVSLDASADGKSCRAVKAEEDTSADNCS